MSKRMDKAKMVVNTGIVTLNIITALISINDARKTISNIRRIIKK